MRRALAWLLVVVTLAAAGVLAGLGVLYARADTSTVGELDFANELRIPPLLEGEAGGDGVTVFDLRLQTGTSELVPGTTTETWGINGPHLGPTLRLARGDRVRMEVRNELPERTTVHWHGMHSRRPPTAGPTSRSSRARGGPPAGRSTSPRPRSGTTRIRIPTATSRSTGASPG